MLYKFTVSIWLDEHFFEIRSRWENNNLLKSIEELENWSLFICIILLWQFLGMTIFRDQWWHHPDRKFVQHGWRGTCGSSLLHNTDFSTQRILPRQRTPSVASPDSGAPHGDHWFNGRLTFRSHFPILRWFFYLDIILQWNLRKIKEIIFLVLSLQDML